jgi:hypothetical protein
MQCSKGLDSILEYAVLQEAGQNSEIQKELKTGLGWEISSMNWHKKL